MAAKLKTQVGDRFGRLVIQARFSSTPNGITTWTCLCDCGKTKNIRIDVLRNGTSQSCGCLARELSSQRNGVHGASYNRTIEYSVWGSMRQRCLNPSNKDYPNYGGKGITIDPSWDDFATFLRDMGPRPSVDYTLDRYPDNKGNYGPTNCRWATAKEQMHNRVDNTKQLRLLDSI